MTGEKGGDLYVRKSILIFFNFDQVKNCFKMANKLFPGSYLYYTKRGGGGYYVDMRKLQFFFEKYLCKITLLGSTARAKNTVLESTVYVKNTVLDSTALLLGPTD